MEIQDLIGQKQAMITSLTSQIATLNEEIALLSTADEAITAQEALE